MENSIRVGMAEDHLVLRQGIVALLKNVKNIEVLFDVGNGQELIDNIALTKPDVILLDIDMPVMNGREALRYITNHYPEIGVIMLTMHFNASYIIAFLKEGARAFLPKDAGIDEIVKAFNHVHKLGFYHSEQVSEILDAHSKHESAENAKILKIGLTDREVDVLKLLRVKKKTEEIASELNISPRTAEWHRQNLIQKLKCSDMSELINWSEINIS